MRRDDPQPGPDATHLGDEDRLNSFLDAVVTRRFASPNGLDPGIASAAHQIQSLPTPPPDLSLKGRVWEDLMAAYTFPAPITALPTPTVPASRPQPRPALTPPFLRPRPTRPRPTASRRDGGSFATAAFMLILATAISAGVLVLGNRDGGEPSALPAGIAATAQPASTLYIGHAARLTAEIPGDWTVDPTSNVDYSGPGGFVASEPVIGQSLDEACATLAASQRFDASATVTTASWNEEDACHVTGQVDGKEAIALVVPQPYPFDLWADRYTFAAVIAEPDDLDAIAATLDFSPDRVTPEAYATSLLDLVEARSYWSDAVDWPTVRRQVLDFVEGLDTVEMARQGILNIIVQNLQIVGDNHSQILLPDTITPPPASSSGALVIDTQVVAVVPDGPADRAGVRVGDSIEALDGIPSGWPWPIPVDPLFRTQYDPASSDHTVVWTVRRLGVSELMTVPVESEPASGYVPPIGRRLPDAIGYLQIPGFTAPGQETAYAATGNTSVATIDAPPTCGWVIDLRLDTGGSYSPMVTAFGPILGNGAFVGWRYGDDRQSWVTYEDGRITDDDYEVSNYLGEQTYDLQRPSPPVAVLTGPLTASAGEVAALAFVGRPSTRLFGEPTAGLTTANQSFALFDGAILALSTSAMTDRTGATHPDGIQPDEPIPTDWTTYGTDADPVLVAAQAWLAQRPACADGEA